MKAAFTASADDLVPDDASSQWSLRGVFASSVAAMRNRAANRSLRRQLSGLDDAILRDIGIGEDEIWRMRAGNAFTPRAWL
jgi:uncharacterized protein YjiS (DUF1127 family)